MTDLRSLSIRPARPEDVETILSMITELAQFEQLAHLVVADVSSLHEALFGERPACECIVGWEEGPGNDGGRRSGRSDHGGHRDHGDRDDNRDERDDSAGECIDAQPTAVAFALYFHNFSTFLGRKGLYLEDLYVRPLARRRGHGKAMLAHLAALAVARDCGRFEWSVLDWNANAIGFYESLGAVVMPDWRICRVTGGALASLAGGGIG